MLIKRVFTAAVALPLAVFAILFLPTIWLAVLVAVLMVLAAWEWGTLTALDGVARIVFVGVAGLLMAVMLGYGQAGGSISADSLWLMLAAAFWVVVAGLVARFPTGWAGTLGHRVPAFLAGLLTLIAPVIAVVWLRAADDGTFLILVLCLMVWGADTGAYAAGRLLGRHKLAPNVSPGKTIEGALGGLLAAMILGALSAFLLGYEGSRILAMALLGGWIAAISIVGDLTLSMFKRSAGVKDSGRLFPGHGGVLDRLDSMLAAAPWFVLGMQAVMSTT